MTNERRSPNGDLWIEYTSNDPIMRARNNLRYWEDRAKNGMPFKPTTYNHENVDCLLNAVRHMIEVIDKERDTP
jgi:hypothetical protein